MVRTMVSRRSLWAAVGAVLLAGCAGRGRAAVEPRSAAPGVQPAPSSATGSPARPSSARSPSATASPPQASAAQPWRAKPGQEYDLAPIPMEIAEPRYPAAARERGIHGTVLVEFVIDTSGGVASARVLQSIPELDAAAIACVRSWRFKPALRAGRAVEVTARAPVRF